MITAVAVLSAVLVSCSAPYTNPPSGAMSAAETALATAVFQQVEGYRRSHGCGALGRHAGLEGIARRHSEFLRANPGKFSVHGPNLSHYGFEQRTLTAQRLYQINCVGENLATLTSSGSAAAPAILKLWINSPTHERNMRSDWAITGIGVAITDDGTAIVTQLFGTEPGNSQLEMRDRLRRH